VQVPRPRVWPDGVQNLLRVFSTLLLHDIRVSKQLEVISLSLLISHYLQVFLSLFFDFKCTVFFWISKSLLREEKSVVLV
jgi:hypothetical protein